jgi:hypothetical protein
MEQHIPPRQLSLHVSCILVVMGSWHAAEESTKAFVYGVEKFDAVFSPLAALILFPAVRRPDTTDREADAERQGLY